VRNKPEREGRAMARTISGTVKDGVIIPDTNLPEGLRVEIVVPDASTVAVSPELQEELEGWDRASDQALDLVERLARGEQPDEKR
jgi:hypothetical protein